MSRISFCKSSSQVAAPVGTSGRFFRHRWVLLSAFGSVRSGKAVMRAFDSARSVECFPYEGELSAVRLTEEVERRKLAELLVNSMLRNLTSSVTPKGAPPSPERGRTYRAPPKDPYINTVGQRRLLIQPVRPTFNQLSITMPPFPRTPLQRLRELRRHSGLSLCRP